MFLVIRFAPKEKHLDRPPPASDGLQPTSNGLQPVRVQEILIILHGTLPPCLLP